jgi:hypothetical protein
LADAAQLEMREKIERDRIKQERLTAATNAFTLAVSQSIADTPVAVSLQEWTDKLQAALSRIRETTTGIRENLNADSEAFLAYTEGRAEEIENSWRNAAREAEETERGRTGARAIAEGARITWRRMNRY